MASPIGLVRSRAAARPLIAVTTSEVRESQSVTLTRHGEPPQHEMALGLKYLQAIEASGGIPVVVPPLHEDAVTPLLERCSGLLLSGGPDLDPDAYGERRHEETGPTERILDSFELAAARVADRRGMPILAICRGLQVLNVARGGTLHQHLPDVVGGRIAHRQQRPGIEPTHWVSVDRGSLLGATLGRGKTKVNSFHHQAVDKVGRGLRPVARASDGTVEALEDRARDFMVAVQWHAECLVGRPAQGALFSAFVEASAIHEERLAARPARHGAAPFLTAAPAPQAAS